MPSVLSNLIKQADDGAATPLKTATTPDVEEEMDDDEVQADIATLVAEAVAENPELERILRAIITAVAERPDDED